MKTADLDFLADAARRYAGLLLRGQRAYLIETRLAPLARREGEPSVEGLIARLRETPDAEILAAVVEALAPSDTTFFRGREVFERLRTTLIPELASRRRGGVVRVWCAGVGAGQEAYSLALLAARGEPMAGVELQIFASDLCERALQKARSGVYSHFEVQRGLPIRLLLDHFSRVDETWRVSEALRQEVRWARINLLDDFSAMGPFDLVLCRNVLCHMAAPAALNVLGRLDEVVARDGGLVLGSGDADLGLEPSAAYHGAVGVYRRNPAFERADAA